MISVLMFSACLADQSLGQRANRVLGKLYNSYTTYLGFPRRDLSAHHRELVNALAQDMKVERAEVHAQDQLVAIKGPHATGNRIYLSDAWFNTWKHSPDVQKFVIGHELAHVGQVHAPIRALGSILALALGIYGVEAASYYTGVSAYADAICTSYLPILSQRQRSFFGHMILMLTGGTVGVAAAQKLIRMQELEADRCVLEKLGPIHGYDVVRRGAAEYFKPLQGFEPQQRGWFARHPHSGDRLRALGLEKSVSQEAGASLEKLLEDRASMRVECALCSEDDTEKTVIMCYRMSKNWEKIIGEARICSVHQDIAHALCKKLGTDRYIQLFTRILAANEQGNAVTSEVISTCHRAISDECALIALCLQEQV